jgi:polyisoprenyl-phosphate glycosyltransferase
MSENADQVVCIIPAFNEASTVASVASTVINSGQVSKLIVIDDGSEDGTSAKAGEVHGVTVIRLETNHGKGAAMRAGLSASNEPVVLFLDADLLDLKPQHVGDLVQPVLSNNADMSIGFFRGGRLVTDLAHMVTPSLSGQRAIRRSIIANLDMDSVGFGIERALTELWKSGSIRVTEVILHGVSHRTKEEKRGYWEGVKQRTRMFAEILRFEGNRIRRKIAGNGSNHRQGQ